MTLIHSPKEKIRTAEEAMALLKEGNQRYVSDQLMKKDTHKEDRATFTEGQNPFAIVLTCSDSRVAPEVYFDQKLGDIFVIRNAGNIVDETVLGSIEYAVDHLDVPLIVVAGHTHCGAVSAAEAGGRVEGSLASIVEKIQNSIENKQGDEAVDANTDVSVKEIQGNDIVKKHGVKVVGVQYEILSGEITWR